MKNFESVKRKIQKLQAMIDRGESNEAETAQKLLRELLEKYQIDISSITEEKVEWRHFKCKSREEASVLFHCYYKVMNKGEVTYKHYRHDYYIELTEYQYLEIKNMYEWHAAKFREELDNMKKDLVDAFVMEHNLTSDDNSDRQDEDFTFTKEDLERFERIMMMQQNLGRERYYKMIGI